MNPALPVLTVDQEMSLAPWFPPLQKGGEVGFLQGWRELNPIQIPLGPPLAKGEDKKTTAGATFPAKVNKDSRFTHPGRPMELVVPGFLFPVICPYSR